MNCPKPIGIFVKGAFLVKINDIKIFLDSLDITSLIGLVLHCDDAVINLAWGGVWCNLGIHYMKEALADTLAVLVILDVCKIEIIRNDITSMFIWKMVYVGVITKYVNFKKYVLEAFSVWAASNFSCSSFKKSRTFLYWRISLVVEIEIFTNKWNILSSTLDMIIPYHAINVSYLAERGSRSIGAEFL